MRPLRAGSLVVAGAGALTVVAAVLATRVDWPASVHLSFGLSVAEVLVVAGAVFRQLRPVLATGLPLAVAHVWTLGTGALLAGGTPPPDVGIVQNAAVLIGGGMSGLLVAALRTRARGGPDLVAPVAAGVACGALAVGLANVLGVLVHGAAVLALAPVSAALVARRPEESAR